MSDSIDEIEAQYEQEQQNRNQQPTADDDGDDSSGPSLGVSKRTLAIFGGVVLVAAAVYWYRSRSSGSTSDSSDSDDHDVDVTLEPDTDEESEAKCGEIVVPQDPNQPLEADRAVIQGLKERGKINGGGS
ncbi:hypothetical protein [Natrialbaceae archaeon AArc-T1-2]|uniref:hypothetical protein n=1 Tax=Natrialbaceae archaeon AArc-T1-2 TaxID=3053904 RepID=UPI00255A9D6E|nr:hypothetical protein [Natrialbaceae archaeon AArc-T1-2]WIV67542.1 hypothetical protein QQ977_02085 [Natrialbaceae archaeon AArc-T1-2]